jgi:hypothetical protein
MATVDRVLGAAEVELLLPWHAAGVLNRRDAGAVDRAIARSPKLARRFDQIRQERAETIETNEGLGVPSARAMTRLFDLIAEDDAAKRRMPGLAALAAQVSQRLRG